MNEGTFEEALGIYFRHMEQVGDEGQLIQPSAATSELRDGVYYLQSGDTVLARIDADTGEVMAA